MAFIGVKMDLAVRNRIGHEAPHSERRVPVLFTVPKVDCYLDVLRTEIPRADHESSIPLSPAWSGEQRFSDHRHESLPEIWSG
jgi:hypothetical protein